MSINDNIRKIREKRGLSQQKAADLMGEKRSTYAEWERDTPPKADALIKIAKAFDVGVGAILYGSDEKQDNLPVATEPDHNYETGTLTMKALVNLTESNRVLAESNKTLAESHSRLVTMVETKSTESGLQEIPEAVDAKLTDALVLLAEIGSGKKWKSVQEGLAEIHKRFSGVHRTVEVKDIQKRGDKLHKEK